MLVGRCQRCRSNTHAQTPRLCCNCQGHTHVHAHTHRCRSPQRCAATPAAGSQRFNPANTFNPFKPTATGTACAAGVTMSTGTACAAGVTVSTAVEPSAVSDVTTHEPLHWMFQHSQGALESIDALTPFPWYTLPMPTPPCHCMYNPVFA